MIRWLFINKFPFHLCVIHLNQFFDDRLIEWKTIHFYQFPFHIEISFDWGFNWNECSELSNVWIRYRINFCLPFNNCIPWKDLCGRVPFNWLQSSEIDKNHEYRKRLLKQITWISTQKYSEFFDNNREIKPNFGILIKCHPWNACEVSINAIIWHLIFQFST